MKRFAFLLAAAALIGLAYAGSSAANDVSQQKPIAIYHVTLTNSAPDYILPYQGPGPNVAVAKRAFHVCFKSYSGNPAIRVIFGELRAGNPPSQEPGNTLAPGQDCLQVEIDAPAINLWMNPASSNDVAKVDVAEFRP